MAKYGSNANHIPIQILKKILKTKGFSQDRDVLLAMTEALTLAMLRLLLKSHH